MEIFFTVPRNCSLVRIDHVDPRTIILEYFSCQIKVIFVQSTKMPLCQSLSRNSNVYEHYQSSHKYRFLVIVCIGAGTCTGCPMLGSLFCWSTTRLVTSVKISSKWCWWWCSLMALTKAWFEIDKAWMLTQHYLIFRNSNMQSLHNKRKLVRTAKLEFWLLQYWFSVGLEFGQYLTLSRKKILSDTFRCLNLRWNFLDGKKHHVQTSLLLSRHVTAW